MKANAGSKLVYLTVSSRLANVNITSKLVNANVSSMNCLLTLVVSYQLLKLGVS